MLVVQRLGSGDNMVTVHV